MFDSKIKNKAIKLRKEGSSYNQIRKILGIAKSTSSLWLRNIKLNKVALQRLKFKEFRGREKSLETIKNRIKERDKRLSALAMDSLSRIQINDIDLLKLLCALLYWSEGEKNGKALSFTNSDPVMIRVYVLLLHKAFGIPSNKLKAILHLHSYHNKRKQVNFWSNITGIPKSHFSLYNKPNSGKNIRKNYQGCIAIRYYNVELLREIQCYYKTFAQILGA